MSAVPDTFAFIILNLCLIGRPCPWKSSQCFGFPLQVACSVLSKLRCGGSHRGSLPAVLSVICPYPCNIFPVMPTHVQGPPYVHWIYWSTVPQGYLHCTRGMFEKILIFLVGNAEMRETWGESQRGHDSLVDFFVFNAFSWVFKGSSEPPLSCARSIEQVLMHFNSFKNKL